VPVENYPIINSITPCPGGAHPGRSGFIVWSNVVVIYVYNQLFRLGKIYTD